MNKFFYPRLAITNIKNNKSIYAPYLLAATLIVSLFYILSSITVMVAESGAKGSGTMGAILELSTWLCGFLALIIIFYINSFIMKRRKKEFGLYSILGMEKRHISIVMAWEVFMTGIASIGLGITCGALFSQLLFLLLLKIIGLPAELTFQIPTSAILGTFILFAIGFVAILIFDMVSIMRTDPIALLRSTKEGEREPKARWLLALIGILTLGGGYVLSWRAQTPSDALNVFFSAVLLVIIGTYLLFITGSIVLLKLLRKNKHFYYKPQNFISVAGMIYRMKQNATGLANICILSTCVLVTLSSTVCLFVGQEDILKKRFPRQIEVSAIVERGNSSGVLLQQAAKEHAKAYGLAVKNDVGYTSFRTAVIRNGNTFEMEELYSSSTYEANYMLLEDYNQITHSDYTLKEGEVLAYVGEEALHSDTMTINGQAFTVVAQIPQTDFMSVIGMDDGVVFVFQNDEALQDLRDAFNNSANNVYSREVMYAYRYDVEGNEKALPEFYNSMRSAFNETVPRLATVDNIDSARDDFYQVYGSIMFVGIFFVALFLIATILIIYYKQITEGFDDYDRFQIMQNVGMSKKEVRITISKQVLMVFFLPLGMAVLHIAVAFPVLCKLLEAFNMTNTSLFLLCVIGAVLAFTVLYLIVYQLTARAYYGIVQSK